MKPTKPRLDFIAAVLAGAALEQALSGSFDDLAVALCAVIIAYLRSDS